MALVSEQVLEQMGSNYQQAFSRIQLAAEAATLDAWYAHQSLESPDDEEWEESYWAILAAAGGAIAALTAAYYQAQRDYLGIAPRVRVPDIAGELRAQFDDYGDSPAVRARFLISEGEDFDAAITGAATRVTKLTSASTRFAEQAALQQMFDELAREAVYEFDSERPDSFLFPFDNDEVERMADDLSERYRMEKKGKGALRWKRSPQANACGYCRAQASRILTDEAKQRNTPWHTHCHCGWRRITAAESRAFEPLSPERFRELSQERFTDA